MLKKTMFSNGIAGMICKNIGNDILVYGGSSFPNGTPPYGTKVVYNDIYVFDKELNKKYHIQGNINPYNGIVIQEYNNIWYILDNKIYEIEYKDNKIEEKEIFTLPFSLGSGFGCKYKDSLIFGKDKVYRYDLLTKELIHISDFIGEAREQSVYSLYNDSIYVLGGASNIAYMDSYRYDILANKWHRLSDIPASFTGSSSVEYDDNHLMILGGFNKEVYDDAVPRLSDIEYKKEYFAKPIEHFNWNNNIYLYEYSTDTYKILDTNKEYAKCGAGLVNIDKQIYIISGEVKPGFRSKDVVILKENDYEKKS